MFKFRLVIRKDDILYKISKVKFIRKLELI